MLVVASVEGKRQKPKPTKKSRAQTFQVQVGLEVELGSGVSGMGVNYYPSTLNVVYGDSIVFTLASNMEPHTVSFGSGPNITTDLVPDFALALTYGSIPPVGPFVFDGVNFVSSSWLFPGSTFTIQILAPPGIYKYRCALHPLMAGFVVVSANRQNGNPQADAKAQLAADTSAISFAYETAQSYLANQALPGVELVIVGFGNGDVDLYGFMPNVVQISVGTTIRFVNMDPFTPHSVTLNATAGTCLSNPLALANPGFACGGSPSGPNDFFTSGWLWPIGTGLYGSVDASSFDVTFDYAGTYNVYCLVHEFMQATIIVS